MIAMTRLVLALAVSTLLADVANGAQHPFFQQTLPGGVHQNGDAVWEDQAEQMTSIDCGKYSLPRHVAMDSGMRSRRED